MVGARVVHTPDELREIRALLLLRDGAGLGDRGIKALVTSFGSGWLALRSRGIQQDLLAPEADGPPVSSWLEKGFEILAMTSPSYPSPLLELSDPPPVLFLKGKRDLLSGPSVAIVGSRRASGVGRRAAETLGRVLSGAGVTVVSGMALGIDGAAHRGALQAGGRTVAVLGSGLGVVYPASHRGLSRELAAEGLLISEFLPDEPALRHHFPKRNRIIAALAQAIIVVEAGQKSGALITVDHGLDLGRDILATPGSVENAQARGSNALLREGARVLPDPDSVLDELESLGVLRGRELLGKARGGIEKSVPSGLRGIWRVLSGEPRYVDEVAGLAAVSPAEALAGLGALELGGWARQCPGMRFQRIG